VACVAEGPREKLEGLLAAIHQGPGAADVRHVSAAWMPSTGRLAGFSIRSGGHPGD